MLELTIDEYGQAQVSYQDSQGNPAPPPGPIAWASSAQSVVSLRNVAGNVAEIWTEGTGSAVVTATSEGITASLDVQVGGGAAVSATIDAQAQDKPAQPAALTARVHRK